MATFNYGNLRDGAVKRLLDSFGQTVTVSVWSEGSYNATTGAATPTNTDYTVRGVVLDYEQAEIDGGAVQRGDRKVLAYPQDTSGTSYSPNAHSKVTISSAEHEVVSVTTVSPGGTAVLYELQIRGA